MSFPRHLTHGQLPILFLHSDPYLLTLTVGTGANVFRHCKYIQVNTVWASKSSVQPNADHIADPTLSLRNTTKSKIGSMPSTASKKEKTRRSSYYINCYHWLHKANKNTTLWKSAEETMPSLTGRGSWLLAQMGRGDRGWGSGEHGRGRAQETGKMKPLLSLWKHGA